MEAAFKLAFDTLKSSNQNEFQSGCNTIIMFLTDGEPKPDTDRNTPPFIKEDVLQQNEELMAAAGKSAAVFTYSFGSGTQVFSFCQRHSEIF